VDDPGGVRVVIKRKTSTYWEGEEMAPPKLILRVAEGDSAPAEVRDGGGGCQSDLSAIGRGCGVVYRVRVRAEAEGQSKRKRNDEWGGFLD